MVRIPKSDFVSYFAHGLLGACQQILDAVDDGKVDVFDGGFACFFLDKVAEIVGGEMPPNMVREFIKTARLTADYKFAVLTYGNRNCNAVELWDKTARAAGHAFDYITTILMVDNWLPNFDMAEQMKIDKRIPENLARISADLKAQKRWHEPVTSDRGMLFL